MHSKIRIVLAEDHTLVRQGFKELLQKHSRFEINGEAGNGRELLDLLKRIQTDIVLLDIEMPVMDGFEALKVIQLRYPKIKVIILSMHYNIAFIYDCMSSGALSCLNKNSMEDEMSDCIVKVFEEGMYLPPKISQELLVYQSKIENNGFQKEKLTPKEKEITIQLCNGKTEKEIAGELNVSQNTVHFHKSSIYRKTGSHNLADLIKYSFKHKIILLESKM